MSRGRLAIHAHFYQPLRLDPFTGTLPGDPTAAPFHDWNERINDECYRPNAELGTLGHISFNLGPTLAAWMSEADPSTYRAFVAADRPFDRDPSLPLSSGNAVAQGFHHSILPLASAADRRTEIRWGLRDFLVRYGRPAEGFWLPETAVDAATLRALALEGIRHTILAPWQADARHLDTRRPYRVELGGGHSIVVAFYDATLSGAVSFEPGATADADAFVLDRVVPRLAGTPRPDDGPGLILIATDGELYGHHQEFRDLFLNRLVVPGPDEADRGVDVVTLAQALDDHDGRPFPVVRVRDRTSWSCHHGIARWSAECPDAADGRWKAPLRAAMERLAAAIDAVTETRFRTLPGEPDLWAARDEFVDVVIGVEAAPAFSARWLGEGAPVDDRHAFIELLEAQRWRLAMFASDGWYWDDPIRPETKNVLRYAARAVRIVDGLAGSRLEQRLQDDLELLRSPSTRLDGAEIYRLALSEVDQPALGPGGRVAPDAPSARGLRATG